jgi:hypothetical protein
MKWVGMLLLPACAVVESGKYAPDPGTYPSDDTDVEEDVEDTGTLLPVDDCDDAPLVNWNNFGEGFFIQNCNGCHHSETPHRYGAPESVIFDTAEDVWDQKAMVLYVAGGDVPSMPPQGGSTPTEREMLEIWLNCGESGS